MRIPFLALLAMTFVSACGGGDEPAPPSAEPAVEAPVAAPSPAAAPVEASPEPATAAAAPSTDCEGLSDYESYVDSYIATMERVNGGDPTAASSLMEMQMKANKAGESLAKLEPGSACYGRYIAIQKKMTDASLRMGGASAKDQARTDEAYKQLQKSNDALGCMQKCQSMSDPMQQMSCLQGCQ